MTTPDIIQNGPERLVLEGPLGIYNAQERKQQLMDALQSAGGLALDLSRVDEIDTAGVQLLILARRESRQQGKPLTLLSPSAAVRDVLSFYYLNDYLGVPVESAGGAANQERT